MSSEKLFSRLLAKSLLVPAVVSCFSCSFVFAMEDNSVLDNIKVATRAVVNSIISDLKSYISIIIYNSGIISNSGYTTGIIIEGKSEYIRKCISDRIPNIDKEFKSRVKAALRNDKFKNYKLSLERLDQPDALGLLKDFALDYYDSMTETMLTELGVSF